MTNSEMLELIRTERHNQVIHEVISFIKNKYGFYTVLVDMESYIPTFIDDDPPTKTLHTKIKLPYPLSNYLKLNTREQLDFRWDF